LHEGPPTRAFFLVCDNARPHSRVPFLPHLDPTPFALDIVDLSHDGRGVARNAAGKTVFVAGALPGERVMARQLRQQRNFDEALTLEVLTASADRVASACAHFGVCAGCVLQHLDAPSQIASKQRVLLDNFQRIGKVTPQTVLAPLTDVVWGYRRKGRFSVRWVEKKGKVLIGFRELDGRYVADLSSCATVIPQIGEAIADLSVLIGGLQAKRDIPQIEFIAGEGVTALIVRHVVPLSDSDRDAWIAFAQARSTPEQTMAVFLQPGGLQSVHALWPEQVDLYFDLPPWDVRLRFAPLDFIQVNAGLNVQMIARAIELLDPQPHDRVLDLFAGLGNFTLPLARLAGEVVGVEGDVGLVQRARDNATSNGLPNAQFHAADLNQDLSDAPWMRASRSDRVSIVRSGFSKLLLDPPRSGADAVLRQLPMDGLQRIVYVSCHPASLARDAGYLVHERGWTLQSAGVMDMFPHTAHVESIALFVKA